jgi:hypothetical protein
MAASRHIYLQHRNSVGGQGRDITIDFPNTFLHNETLNG